MAGGAVLQSAQHALHYRQVRIGEEWNMRWLWFVGSLLSFVVVFRTTSLGLAFVCLILAFVFMIVGTLAVASGRIADRSSNTASLLGPDELRRLREARERQQAGTDSGIVGASTAALMMASESGRHAVPHESGDAGDSGGDSD